MGWGTVPGPYLPQKRTKPNTSPLSGDLFIPITFCSMKGQERKRLAGFCFQVNRERSLGWAVSRPFCSGHGSETDQSLCRFTFSWGTVCWTESSSQRWKEGPGWRQGASHSPPPTQGCSIRGTASWGLRECALGQGLHTS